MTVAHEPVERVPAHRHRARHRWLIALVALAVVVGGTFAFGALRYVFRSHPGPRSVDSALERFRSTTTSAAVSAGFGRPAAGVYAARGQGEERISFPPNSQTDGPGIPITVQALANGCWRFRVDFNTAHWQDDDFCPRAGELLLTSNHNSQSWDFGAVTVTNLATLTCDPPNPVVVADPRPGRTLPSSCRGGNTAIGGVTVVTGSATIVGPETLTIDGVRVPTIRQRRQQTVSGAQHGSVDEDWWFALDTGMPVRLQRDYTLKSDSPIGTVTYTERGSFQLQSMQPRT